MYDLSQYVIDPQTAGHVTLNALECVLNPAKRLIAAKLINPRHITLLSARCNGNANEYEAGRVDARSAMCIGRGVARRGAG